MATVYQALTDATRQLSAAEEVFDQIGDAMISTNMITEPILPRQMPAAILAGGGGVDPQALSDYIKYPEFESEYSQWTLSIAPLSDSTNPKQKIVLGSYEESVPGEYSTYLKLGESPRIAVTTEQSDRTPRLQVGRQVVPLRKDLPTKTSQLSNDSGYPTYQNPGHFIKYDAYPSNPNRWIINFGRSSAGGITLVSDEDNPISSYIDIAGRIITAGGGSQTRSGAGLQSVAPSQYIAVDDRPLAFVDQLSDYAQKNETSSAAELSAAFADCALTSQIPTAVSQLDNDSGYVDSQAVQGMLDSYYQKSETSSAEEIDVALEGFYAKSETSSAAQISTAFENIDLSGYVKKTSLSDYYVKAETSSAAELSTAFSGISVEVDPALRTDIDNKVLVNEVSAQSLKINIMALSDYQAISGTAAFDPDAFYCISDDNAGGGGGDMSNYYTKAETSSAAELQAAFSTASGYDLGKTYVKYADGSTVAYNLTGYVNGNLSATIENPLDAVEVRVGSNVTAFGDDGFRKWTSLTAVYYPDSVVSLGDHVFLGDTKLVHVELPDRISSLGGYMFENCSSLSSLKIPSNLVSLVEGTFKRSTSLKKIEFPESLTSTSRYIFNGTSDLTAVFLGKTQAEIEALPEYNYWQGTRLVVSGWIPASQEWVESQIPQNTSQLSNDSGFVDQTALENYYTRSETSSAAEISEALGDINTILEGLN